MYIIGIDIGRLVDVRVGARENFLWVGSIFSMKCQARPPAEK